MIEQVAYELCHRQHHRLVFRTQRQTRNHPRHEGNVRQRQRGHKVDVGSHHVRRRDGTNSTGHLAAPVTSLYEEPTVAQPLHELHVNGSDVGHIKAYNTAWCVYTQRKRPHVTCNGHKR